MCFLDMFEWISLLEQLEDVARGYNIATGNKSHFFY